MTEREEYILSLLDQLRANDGAKIGVQPDQESMKALDMVLKRFRVGCIEDAPSKPEYIYRICHGVAKQYDLYGEMRQIMRLKWGASSMREMEISELKELFYFMRGMESLKKRF